MHIWLELHFQPSGDVVLVNMDQVTKITLNNSTDPSAGTVLYFGQANEFDGNYIIVRETYDSIHTRLSQYTRMH